MSGAAATMDPVIALLRELVAIDSVNPSLVPGGAGEARVAARIVDACLAAGCQVHVDEVAPGRPNVVGVLEGRRAGRTILLCGHTDTVGVAGMVDPFAPVERDGRLFGRGAQDMKAGIAAMIDVARVIAARGGLARGRLIVAAVVDEEFASIGADALVRSWRADAAVVTEPTDLRLAIAHKGFSILEVTTAGVAAHGSRPADGRDAILRMARVMGALEALDRDLGLTPGHPLLGPASLHASTIEGGREASTYPDACRLLMERRTIPGEAPGVAVDEVRSILTALRERDPEFVGGVREVMGRQPFEIDARAELPTLLGRLLERRGLDASPSGVSFWTDAQILSAAGIPTVVFGPGGAGLHSLEEYVRIAEVTRCRDVLVDLVEAFV